MRVTTSPSSSPSRKRRKTRKTPAAASSAKPYLASADRNDSLQRRLGSGGPVHREVGGKVAVNKNSWGWDSAVRRTS